jgi:hypothetical protein
MKISLRKANAIQTSINEALRAITVQTTVSIGEFEQVDAAIHAAREKAIAADSRQIDLTTALYRIRKLVGNANANAGINDKLVDIAYITKRIEQRAAFVSASAAEANIVLNGKLDKIRNRKEDSQRSLYGLVDTVDTGVFGAEAIKLYEDATKQFKKDKQKLNDELLELNIRTQIELDADTVATLQAEGLI